MSFSRWRTLWTFLRPWFRNCLFLLLLSHPVDGYSQELPGAAEQRFDVSRRLLLQGDLDGALLAARDGLKLGPRSVEGLNLLGIIYDQQKQYAQAKVAFEEALSVSPRSTKTHNNLGNHYILENKPDLAEREFRATLRLNPSDPGANYSSGLLLLGKGNAPGAITYLTRVRPRDANTSFGLVQAYLRAGETAKALALARALSNEARNDPKMHFSLGMALARDKQYAPAVHELELADSLNPGNFEILHDLGQAYLRNQNQPKAEDALSRALALKPDSVETMYLLAQAETSQRKYLEALDILLRARNADPKNVDVLFLMGQISMIQNFYEDAIAMLEEGTQIAPQRPMLHAALGECYLAIGKTDRTIDEFKTLIRLDASASSYAFMGTAYRHLGRFDEARKYCDEGLVKDPHNATCLYSLGYIAGKQGRYTEAERLLDAALKSDPENDEALYELASVKMIRKKYAEAIPLLRRCTKSMLQPAEAYYRLATAERNLHQRDAAARDLKVFETLAKNQEAGLLPFRHLFEALNWRLGLAPRKRAEVDLEDVKREVEKHPHEPRNFYFLAEAYLKLGKLDDARNAIAQLGQLSDGDYRTTLGVGTLFAKYRLYPEAIQHFQVALTANPASDDVKYDLADAYFQIRDYPKALELIQQVSPEAQNDSTYLALSGDILAHLGRTSEAARILEKAVERNPDNDGYVLALALVELRAGDLAAADKVLHRALTRIPNAGRLYWGLGIVSVMEGRNRDAERHLAHAVELLPDWSCGYSALGTFYYQTGQILKARQMLGRYRKLFPRGALDVSRIEHTLAAAHDEAAEAKTLSTEARLRFLATALALADQTP